MLSIFSSSLCPGLHVVSLLFFSLCSLLFSNPTPPGETRPANQPVYKYLYYVLGAAATAQVGKLKYSQYYLLRTSIPHCTYMLSDKPNNSAYYQRASATAANSVYSASTPHSHPPDLLLRYSSPTQLAKFPANRSLQSPPLFLGRHRARS
ncbi:hypothetical protein Cob_v002641 [Colletotrichum orbiculare MAFF 240422]|uniref:Uncharacterized protein n=1 Tax=Colletotrichum orbiculare (strain 104-T / ATCC 96160 / CBS 514.97 / LARS 414 / MAFF 240422) TaxID=1213857 RepID=A0A484G2D1_COLOR|nr:hypothetical protein Cob_v002641 [Colletotrichum orbiculare MAFF 240422]